MEKLNKIINYFIYLRKSSDSEDRQVQSIEAQKRELLAYAKQKNLNILSIFEESKSAKEPGRPVFTEMIGRINKGEANGLLVWKINRLARNPVDGGTISWLLQQNILQNIQTIGQGYFPTDNVIVMAVELGVANQYVRDLSTDTKRGMRERAEKGLTHGVAAIGYLNDLSAEPGDRGWLVDKKRFGIIRQLLEMFLTGNHSVRSLLHVANEEMGLRTPVRKRQGGKPIALSYMYSILKNPVYAGFFFIQDKRYELKKSIPRMISKEQYWEMEAMLGRNGRPCPSKNKYSFPYTGRMKCGTCGGSVTAEHKYQLICPECKLKFWYPNKSNCPRCGIEIEKMENPKYLHYIYYHCTRKRNSKCHERSVQEKDIDIDVASYFGENLEMSPLLSDWCIKHIYEIDRNEKENEFEQKMSWKNQKEANKQEYLELIRMKTRNTIDEDDFSALKDDLKADMERIDKVLAGYGETHTEALKRAEKAFSMSVGIAKVFKSDKFDEKTEALAELGSNLTLQGKKANVANKKLISMITNGLLSAKVINPAFEPAKCKPTKGKTEPFDSVRPTLLRG